MRRGNHLIILYDQRDWLKPLFEALQGIGLSAEGVDIREWVWSASSGFLDWRLVVNRVSARPEVGAGHPASVLRKTQDVLAGLELSGIPCVNGCCAYAVGSSKALQAVCFQQAGVKTPLTTLTTGVEGLPEDPDNWLVKPNPGGFGKGVAGFSPTGLQAALAMDGTAVIQERVHPGQTSIYRAEFVGQELAYLAASPLEAGETNYCLAGAGEEVHLSREMPADLEVACRRILELADMRLGSVEYLIDEAGEAVFIDINPVSSPHPEALQRLGVDLWAMQAKWIAFARREPPEGEGIGRN